MFNIWCLGLWFCSNRWPNEVTLSSNGAAVQFQMFSHCALSLPLWRITGRCGHGASETRAPSSGTSGFSCSALEWSWCCVLLARGVVKAALCVLEGKEQLMFWCGSWFVKAPFFGYAQILLGHSLNSDPSCPVSSRILVFFPQSWDLCYGNHKH